MTSRLRMLQIAVLALLLSSCIDCSFQVHRHAECPGIDPERVDSVLREDPLLTVSDITERVPDAYEDSWSKRVDLKLYLDLEYRDIPGSLSIEGDEIRVTVL